MMNLLDGLFQRLWSARTRDFWDKASLVAILVGAIATFAATVFAFLSARASLEAVEETRAARNPVFVAEPRDETVIVQFRNDEGFRAIPVPVNADPALTESAPVIRFTNYGSAPAVNVRIDYRWRDEARIQHIPDGYIRELVRGLPRISMKKGYIYATLEDPLGGVMFAPVGTRGHTTIGSIGPGATREVRLPPQVTYALYPLMLNDAERHDQRTKAYLANRQMPPMTPIAQHHLQVDVSSDSITGSRFAQQFVVRFTVVQATDRGERISGSQFGKDTLPRVEASNRIEVASTTFPERTQ